MKKWYITILSCLSMILMLIHFYPKSDVTLIQLGLWNQKQGMGYIIKTTNGKVIVIDGGREESVDNLKEQIEILGGKVDAWFLTHPHVDHVEAFMKIIEEGDIPVERVYTGLNSLEWYLKNEEAARDDDYEIVSKLFTTLENMESNHIDVEEDETIIIDDVKVKVLSAHLDTLKENQYNNSSMILQVKANHKKILFLGDVGVEGSLYLLQKNINLKSDIVQVAHHGQNGATKELYEAISPTTCFWPTPEWLWKNDSGLGENTGPWFTKTTKQWLDEIGAETHYVAQLGNIEIKI